MELIIGFLCGASMVMLSLCIKAYLDKKSLEQYMRSRPIIVDTEPENPSPSPVSKPVKANETEEKVEAPVQPKPQPQPQTQEQYPEPDDDELDRLASLVDDEV